MRKGKVVWTGLAVAAAAALLLIMSVSRDSESTQKGTEENGVSIYFFHDTACASCNGAEDFFALVSVEIEPYKEAYPYHISVYNVFKTEERERAGRMLAQYDTELASLRFPAMMINGKVYEGMESIEKSLQTAYLGGAELKAVYFYRDDCEECMQLKPYLESLPGEILIGKERVPLVIEALASRSGDNGEVLRQFFRDYDVPEEKQMVPFVILGDKYLAGADEIRSGFIPLAEKGYGLAGTGEFQQKSDLEE